VRILATLPDARDWPELWLRAGSASRRLLLLDFDGTLAPFTVERQSAVLPPAVRAILRTIATRSETLLGVVSGRRLEELETRFAGIPAHLVGEHGWDERLADGTRRTHELTATAGALLAQVGEELARRAPAGQLEIKRTSLVVHTRGQDPATAEALRLATARACRALRNRAELALRDIDGGWELRARGHDKGTAALVAASEAGRPVFTVYLGDDETDEDAFAAVRQIGFGVCVGLDDRSTHAQARLPGVAAVWDFLQLWAARLTVAEASSQR